MELVGPDAALAAGTLAAGADGGGEVTVLGISGGALVGALLTLAPPRVAGAWAVPL